MPLLLSPRRGYLYAPRPNPRERAVCAFPRGGADDDDLPHLFFLPLLFLLLHPGLPLALDDVPGVLLGLAPDGRDDPPDVLAPGQTLDPCGGELSPLLDHGRLFWGPELAEWEKLFMVERASVDGGRKHLFAVEGSYSRDVFLAFPGLNVPKLPITACLKRTV